MVTPFNISGIRDAFTNMLDRGEKRGGKRKDLTQSRPRRTPRPQQPFLQATRSPTPPPTPQPERPSVQATRSPVTPGQFKPSAKPQVVDQPQPAKLPYSRLRNDEGLIYDATTGRKYKNPTELAADLGIQPHLIDWSRIQPAKKADQPQPAPPPEGPAKPATPKRPEAPQPTGTETLEPPTRDIPEPPEPPTLDPKYGKAIEETEKIHRANLKLSENELSTQEDLDKLMASVQKAYVNIEDQPIPMQFITGQLSSIERRALAQAEPLERKLSRMQAERLATQRASKFALERADQRAERARDLAEFGYQKEYEAFEEDQERFEDISREQQIVNAYNEGAKDPVDIFQSLEGEVSMEEINDTLEQAGAGGATIGQLRTVDGIGLVNVREDGSYDVLIPEGKSKEDLTYKQRVDLEMKIGNNFEKYAKEARGALRQTKIMEQSYQEALENISEGEPVDAAGQGILVTFQKVLDPTSVVRESEYARSSSGLSLVNRIEGKYDQLKRGGPGITVEDLKQFVDLGQRFMKGYEGQMIDYAKRSKIQSENYGLNIENILTPDVLEILEEAEAGELSELEQYYVDNPGQQKKMEQMIEENPDLSDDEILQILGLKVDASTGGVDKQSTSPNPQGKNRPQKNNNPLNIKASQYTEKYPGVIGKEAKPAQDGGHFLQFESPESGFAGAQRLLSTDFYQNKTLEQAMRAWSGGGYGGEIMPSMKNTKLKDFSSSQLKQLVEKMAQREGYYA